MAAALLALAVPGMAWGQAMAKAVLEGPSPWPAPAAGEHTSRNGAVAPPAASGAIASGGPAAAPSLTGALATNGAGTNGAVKVEPKDSPSAPLGGAGKAGVTEVKTPEAPPAMAGTGTGTEPVKPAANPIELTPIGGHGMDVPAVPANGPEGKGGTGGWGLSGLGGIGQTAAALAIVLGLVFIGRGLVRKFVPGARASNGTGVIEILARHPLAKNQSIVLVRIGSQIVALNQGREASESVLVISDATEVARIIGQIEGKNPNSISAGFNKLLANARLDLEEENDPKAMSDENLDEQLEEMAAAKRQLMELRQHVRSVRDSLPRT